MRRYARAHNSRPLILEASRFVHRHAGHSEVLLIANTRGAADDLVRSHCAGTGGVHRFTLPQLVATLAATPMAERGLTPLNRFGAEALAARAVHRMAGRLQYFGPVAASPGFGKALSRTILECRMENVLPARLAATGLPGADISELLQLYATLLTEGRFADYPMLLRLAQTVLRGGAHGLAGLPVAILDVPMHSAAATKFVEELTWKAEDALVLTLAGDEETISRLGGEFENIVEPGQPLQIDELRRHLFQPLIETQTESDGSFEFFSAAGEGLECAEIARRIHELAAAGMAFDEIGVLVRDPARYQALLEEALTRAGVPSYFTHGVVRPDPAGRALLALLACAMENYPATRFAEYLSLGQAPAVDVPKRFAAGAGVSGTFDEMLPPAVLEEADVPESEASPPTPAAWEKLIVDAAVVGGRERWERRLRGLENALLLKLQRSDEPAVLERQLERLRLLQRLVIPVIERLAALPRSATWGEWLERLTELAQETLRQPSTVLLALNELWPMAEVGPVSLEEVYLVLNERLRFLRRPPERRRYGRIWVGSLDEARGQCFRAVFLPGLAEGVFPKKTFEDPLLLDVYRKQLDGALPRRDTRAALERLRLRIACAAVSEKLVVSYPRMDVVQNRPRVPSFYAMEVVRAAEGRLPELKAFERRAAHGALTRLGWPAPANRRKAIDALEFDLAALEHALAQPRGSARGAGRYLFSLNPHLRRSLVARYHRWGKAWSGADGLVAREKASRDALLDHSLGKRPYSASALQLFASCPYKFALQGILRLRPREAPVPLEEMDALIRGELFHRVQFELFQHISEGMTEDLLDAADEVLNEVAAEFADRLAPAIPRVWQGEVEDLRADLHGWLRRMSTDARTWEPAYSELAFGLALEEHGRDPHSSPDPVTVLDSVQLRGSIDWIESHPETGELRITDHKTGKRPVEVPRFVGKGAVLQPLLYALAAEQMLQRRVRVSRLYYCTQRGAYEEVSVPLIQEARETLKEALHLIDLCIAEGMLPAAPADKACQYCDYRIVCGPRELERTRRKQPLSALEQLRGLA